MSTNEIVKRQKSNRAADLIKKGGGVAIALIALFIIFSIAADPFFLTQNNITNLIKQVITNMLLAYALTYCLIIGEIDLSVGSLLAFSGVMTVTLLLSGVPFVLSLIISTLLCAGFGILSGFLVAYAALPSFIVTLAMQSVIRGTAYLITGGSAIKSTDETFFQFGNGSIGFLPNSAIVTIVVTIVLILVLKRSVFGRHMYAVGGNANTAAYSGINVKSIKLKVFIISGALSGLAGVLAASRIYSGQPTIGEGFEGDAIAAAVLGGTAFTGGRGGIPGTILGVFVIGIINNGLNLLEVNTYWQLVIKGIIIIFAIYADHLQSIKK